MRLITVGQLKGQQPVDEVRLVVFLVGVENVENLDGESEMMLFEVRMKSVNFAVGLERRSTHCCVTAPGV